MLKYDENFMPMNYIIYKFKIHDVFKALIWSRRLKSQAVGRDWVDTRILQRGLLVPSLAVTSLAIASLKQQ